MAMMTFAIGITILNLILILILFGVYLQNYLKIKASINLGLLLFASVFIAQKLTAVYMLFSMMDHSSLLGTPMFILEILEFFAFSSLLWITIK